MSKIEAVAIRPSRRHTRKSLLQHVSAAALMTPAMAAAIAAGGIMVYSRPSFGQAVLFDLNNYQNTTVDLGTYFGGPAQVGTPATVNVNADINAASGNGIFGPLDQPNAGQVWNVFNNGNAITGNDSGVLLNSPASSFTNLVDGTVTGNYSGILIGADNATVTNQAGATAAWTR